MNRIYIQSKIDDARARTTKSKMAFLELSDKIDKVAIATHYTVDKKFAQKDLANIASLISNPVTEETHINTFVGPKDFDTAIEIGFLPGVTDNVATTVKEIIQDSLNLSFSSDEGVYSSSIYFVKGNLTQNDITKIADSLYNPLIQKAYIQTASEFRKNKGSNADAPKVSLHKKPSVKEINLNVDDKTLGKIGKEGILNDDGTLRGPLSLDLVYMKTIQKYFKKVGRAPTDIELESLAQTWSEHCKHTIFADPIDDIKDGLFKTFIKKATEAIRKNKGSQDFCVSVFKDNSGAIEFDKDYLVTHKLETHNTPSALDPYGGAITGIVGVNRDTLGFGLSAQPIVNLYGFCFADPEDRRVLYRDYKNGQKMLSSYRIMQGVIEGINSGGNTSGIPTPLGFMYFDPRYLGKPLVFAGTVGLIPRKSANRPSHVKKAHPGDYIVMIGGRVGIDGIHGATFSSEELHEKSPASSVQIGDPITQKKFSDALVREARDMRLYNSITDCGAGGLSSAVAEMALQSGGCDVDLEKVPLKYAGLDPWQIWISESQERMILAIPPNNWQKFKSLMGSRGVEATVIGTFTSTDRCVIKYDGKVIMDMDMDFLHYGLPPRPMKTMPPASVSSQAAEPTRLRSGVGNPRRLNDAFLDMLSWSSHASNEFISMQYDHEVQGSSILKPLQGKGKVNAEAAVVRPVLNSKKGVVLGYGMYPSYSDIDTYHMTAASIDSAVRTAVAAGAPLGRIALLDNFCWSSSDDPKRLYQLKEAAQACYDIAVAYGTPYISGKDSMFNDFKGYDERGNKIKISVPPTLLISSLAVVDDHAKVVSIDAKVPGDLVYLLGETHYELGGSQYSMYLDAKGGDVPQVHAEKNKKLYEAYGNVIEKGLLSSAIALTKGGLALALAKTALAGMLGMNISLKSLVTAAEPTRLRSEAGNPRRLNDEALLFSESQGRILVTVDPQKQKEFQKIFKGNPITLLGKVMKEPRIRIKGSDGKEIVTTSLDKAMKAYKKTFAGY